MFNFGNKTVPILVSSLIVSIMLHFTVLFLVLGYNSFLFSIPPLRKGFFIYVKEEISSNPQLTEAVKHPLLKTFSDKKDIKKDESNPPSPPFVKGGKGGLPDKYRGIIMKENNYAVVVTNNERVSGKTKETLNGDVKNRTNKYIAEVKVSERPTDVKSNDLGINAVSPLVKQKSVQLLRSNKEKLFFDIYWLGIYVGKAVLEASYDNGILRITSQAYSAPFISTFYKVEDHAESLIIEGVPVNFRIKQREGRYRSDKETIFDMGNRMVTYFNYLKGFKDEHVIKNGFTWDVISGFFYLRTQPLIIGKTVFIDIFDSNKFYKAKVEVLRKEKIGIPNRGEISTVIVKPELQSEGLFQRKGDVLIWLTDDEKKIPVRIQTKVPVGNVVAELRDSEIK